MPFYSRVKLRRLFLERLECRFALDGDGSDPINPADVNDDGEVAPVDAIIVANEINDGDPAAEDAPEDVNGDGEVNEEDFDAVIAVIEEAMAESIEDLSEEIAASIAEPTVEVPMERPEGLPDVSDGPVITTEPMPIPIPNEPVEPPDPGPPPADNLPVSLEVDTRGFRVVGDWLLLADAAHDGRYVTIEMTDPAGVTFTYSQTLRSEWGTPDGFASITFPVVADGTYSYRLTVSEGLVGGFAGTFHTSEIDWSNPMETVAIGDVLSASGINWQRPASPGGFYIPPPDHGPLVDQAVYLDTFDPTPQQEFDKLKGILNQAVGEMEAALPGILGQGWESLLGNGPSCDAVHNGLSTIMKELWQYETVSQRFLFDDYDFASVATGGLTGYVSGGYWPMTEHVYFGIIDKHTGLVVAVADPWRDDAYFEFMPVTDDPNWHAQVTVTPWNASIPASMP